MDHTSFSRIDHRPWPVPARPWIWRQTWRDLLFLHWPVPVAALRELVPPELDIDEIEGTSWVGLVPFRMTGVMRRPWPDVPWISAFPELNVRLYVTHQGKPGVWFLSLDAANPVAVWAARRFFHLPYFHARMHLVETGGRIHYSAARKDGRQVFRASYRPVSDVYESAPRTLENRLTERYCLFARAPDGSTTLASPTPSGVPQGLRRGIWRNDVHHLPWPLQRAEVEIDEDSYLSSHGLKLSGPAPLVHFARRLDVVVWSGERVA